MLHLIRIHLIQKAFEIAKLIKNLDHFCLVLEFHWRGSATDRLVSWSLAAVEKVLSESSQVGLAACELVTL